jgi:hypothetical protein
MAKFIDHRGQTKDPKTAPPIERPPAPISEPLRDPDAPRPVNLPPPEIPPEPAPEPSPNKAAQMACPLTFSAIMNAAYSLTR